MRPRERNPARAELWLRCCAGLVLGSTFTPEPVLATGIVLALLIAAGVATYAMTGDAPEPTSLAAGSG